MQGEETTRRELTPADYLAMLRRHWVLILVLTIIGPPIGYIASKIVPPRYVSQTTVLYQPPAVPDTIVPSMDTTTMNQRLVSMKEQILSRTGLEPIIRQFGLYPKDIGKKSMDELVAKLQLAIDVTPIQPLAETQSKDLPGFSIGVTLDDPHKAQDVCTQITSMFIEASNGDTVQQSDQVAQFLTQQLTEAKDSLDAQDAKLASFKAQHLGSLPDDEQTNLNLLTGLNTQLEAASQALARAQQDKTFSENMLQQQLAAVHPTQSGQNPTTIQQQIDAENAQLASLQAMGYKDSYPDVVKAKLDISALQKQLSGGDAAGSTKDSKPAAEAPEITALRSQIHGYEQQIAEKTNEQEDLKNRIRLYESRVQQSPGVEEQYTELTRGRQTANDNYNALLKEQSQAQMSGELNRQQQGEYFHVLDAANLPSKPTFPNSLLFTGGGLAGGLGLGLGLTLFVELKDTSFKNERDVEFTLRLPVLAMIPAVEAVASKKATVPPALHAANADAGLTLRA